MIKLILGNSLEELKKLPYHSVDSIVTDPPYGLEFMGKEWDKFGISEGRAKRLTAVDSKGSGDRFFDYREGVAQRGRYSEMTIKEKSAFQEFIYQWARECFDILKPGGHLLSFGGSRTYHRMACAIEDAGFEIRDQIMWVYGSGFPKSLNISKVIEKNNGIIQETTSTLFNNPGGKRDLSKRSDYGYKYKPQHKQAKQWEGWGTALKPSHEPIVLARKPLSEKSVAENVLKHGTGGINIDGCRVEVTNQDIKNVLKKENKECLGKKQGEIGMVVKNTESHNIAQGRFPANLIHDGSDEIVGLFPNDSQRFFYCAKASKSERNKGYGELEEKRVNYMAKANGTGEPSMDTFSSLNKNHHPTVKPIALMRYLCKLITPPNGTVLDPFMGSGSTGIACKLERFNFIGIEKEEEYYKIAEARIYD